HGAAAPDGRDLHRRHPPPAPDARRPRGFRARGAPAEARGDGGRSSARAAVPQRLHSRRRLARRPGGVPPRSRTRPRDARAAPEEARSQVKLTLRVRVGLGMALVVALGAVTAALAQWGLNESANRVERLHRAADARNQATVVRRGVSDARRLEIVYVT